MPLYDYACPKCSKVFEVRRNISDESPVLCPDCQTESKKKFSGGVTVVYKGSGFYTTDYANKL